jgi:hypothetical protein
LGKKIITAEKHYLGAFESGMEFGSEIELDVRAISVLRDLDSHVGDC